MSETPQEPQPQTEPQNEPWNAVQGSPPPVPAAPVEGTPQPQTPMEESSENASPAQPVSEPGLPPEGDTVDPETEPVPDLPHSPESGEQRDVANDLSGVDREFDDDAVA